MYFMYQSHNLFSFEIHQKIFPPTQLFFTAGFGIKNICFQLFLRVEQKRVVLRKRFRTKFVWLFQPTSYKSANAKYWFYSAISKAYKIRPILKYKQHCFIDLGQYYVQHMWHLSFVFR